MRYIFLSGSNNLSQKIGVDMISGKGEGFMKSGGGFRYRQWTNSKADIAPTAIFLCHCQFLKSQYPARLLLF
jgi:hypothetical protein